MNRRTLTLVAAAAVVSFSPPPWRPDIITPYPQTPGVITPYVPPKPRYPWWVRMWMSYEPVEKWGESDPFAGMWDMPLHVTTR